MKLIDAKCPNCNAVLKLDGANEKFECEYCHHTIMVEDAVATYKLKITGSVSVDGIETNADLIDAANELLDMEEYLKAKKKFLEFSEKCPEKYQGWLGLLICRTRNFTIRDNNILFENDIKKYYEHFVRTAPKEIKDTYLEEIEDYMFPGRVNEEKKEEAEEKAEDKKTENEIKRDKNTSNSQLTKKVLNYVAAGVSLLLFFICLTSGAVLPTILWLIMFLMFLPPLNDCLSNNFAFVKNNKVVIKIILSICAVFSLAALPNIYEDTWIDNNGTFVKLSSGLCYVGTYMVENDGIVYNETYNSEYNHKSEDNGYYIDCGSGYSFRYTDGNLCQLDNGECIKDFMKVGEIENDLQAIMQ